ncbi:gem-associated protein 5 [Orussus abietinus]|uniref:gem-associated protein 5 n=1 Tax=Orussus abietinus TaxID=222816 RepID=UPI000625297A|nr:gem-associated protein 5 [Orussus abietinus]XP_012279689.1 gem-associated protein 5 [Orussus abietinus]XP_012279691.1 gem-associated protein 5 [Orussus abietinus]
MNEVTLPPSPNWYLSTILVCSNDGTIAWGSKNAIVIGKHAVDSKIFKFDIIPNAHDMKVNSLTFSPQFGQFEKNWLASVGGDYVVRVWDLDTLSAIKSYSCIDLEQKMICMDWSKANVNVICCITSDGYVVSWNITYNSAQLISLGKFNATCISCCPHDAYLVAVGGKFGLVCIVDLHGTGTVKYKLRGHDSEIVSLSWCPTDVNVCEGTDAKDMLLASGAKERSIYIWKTGKDARYQTDLVLPSGPLHSHQHRSKLSTTVGNWTVVNWIKPKLLLASSSWGELISWDFSLWQKTKVPWKLVHGHHLRGLFCIVEDISGQSEKELPESSPDDWRSNTEKMEIKIWTTAQDRRVLCCKYDGDKTTILCDMPTQAGFVYCMAACPLDTSRIAFGVGDMMLRLWNLSEPHENTFDITVLWQKIKGKVMTVSWHPEKENLLAFGTGEGRVGVFDVNVNKPPILYRQYHRYNIYSLGWGPAPSQKPGKYFLFSCADGELVYYDPEKPNQEPKSVVKKGCTEFSWKPDFTCLALGFEDGTVSFLDQKLSKCGKTIHSLKKAVYRLAWHPCSTATDLTLSAFRDYLAVAINASTITVFNISNTSADAVDSITDQLNDVSIKDDESIKYDVVATLNGHVDKVVCLAWSPHFSGYLVSGNYNNSAQVWKIETEELLGTFTGHSSPVVSCMWSPLDPDLIMTGSADFTLRVWKLSDQKPVLPAPRSGKKARSKKAKGKSEMIEKTQESEVVATIAESPVDGTVEVIQPIHRTNGQMLLKLPAAKEIQKQRGKRITYFPGYAKITHDTSSLLLSMRSLLQSADTKKGEDSPDNSEVTEMPKNEELQPEHTEACLPSLFCESREDLLSLLNSEKKIHSSKDQHNIATEMDMWSNNLRKNLESAVKERRLNDYLVSLAPSLSLRTWQEMCEAYADQLIFEENIPKAVSYLLCIHKIHKAIEIFKNAKMYREAYVLARCKLDVQKDDPLLKSLLEEWVNIAIKDGSLEEATLCYIKLGNFSVAAKTLGRRIDSRYLELATELAFIAGDEKLGESLIDQTITQTLLTCDCKKARAMIEKFPRAKYYKVHLDAFEKLQEILANKEQLVNVSKWLSGNSEYSLLDNLKNQQENCSSFYENLMKYNCNLITDSKVKMRVKVSHQIALAAIADSVEKQLHHIVTALGSISQFETTYSQTSLEKNKSVLLTVLSSLDAKSPMDSGSIFNYEGSSVAKSLRAYLCLGLLNWLTDEDATEKDEETNSSQKIEVINLIEKYLEDGLDRRSVLHWTRTSEINKLETALASLMVSGKVNQPEDDSEQKPSDENTTSLMEQLDQAKKEKNSFLEERICTPNPMLIYSKATKLGTEDYPLEDSIKTKFSNALFKIWTAAVSNDK